MLPTHLTVRSIFALLLIAACAQPGQSANWSVNRVNHFLLTPPAGVPIAEMSGVTYLGPVGGAHRFIAAEEDKGKLLQFDVTFSAAGAIEGVSSMASININATNDFEGIAYTNPTRNSVFLSSETGQHLREVSLATGATLQNVTIPAVFDNRRGNKGLEALTRTLDGATMWTANQESLTVDGPLSTASVGTTVRLQRLNVDGNAVTAGPQYAYQVDPIHGSLTSGSPQSGISDVAVLPDGTLLALERSVAVTMPLYRHRIYAVDYSNATDVSLGPTATGLAGKTYTKAEKSLLWSGAIDGAAGQNMEGLVLGPQLASGAWVLLGVVDDGNGEPGSSNTIVAFTATPITSADFNADGVVDGADFLQWQRGNGKAIGATHQEGDANRDGAVDAADLELWKASFTAPPGDGTSTAIPEPATGLLSSAGAIVFAAQKKVRRTSRRT